MTSQQRRNDWAESAAMTLVQCRRSTELLVELDEQIRPRTVEEGYHVQRVARTLLEANGFGRQGGWKVGCTTKVMQTYLGVDSPTAGIMCLATMRNSHHEYAVREPRRLGVECEIAVRMGEDLPVRERAYSVDDVSNAVSGVMAAIEVVEDRYVDFARLDLPTLVADDFFHYGCVVGVERRDYDVRHLGEVRASMTINGKEVGKGVGTDILGDPLEVLHWLVHHAARQGSPLRAGDVVLLGSLVKTQWVKSGDFVEVHNIPLGRVAANFT